MQEDILQRMLTKFSLIFRNETLDLDYLLDTVQQELDLAITASNHVNIPEALITGLQELLWKSVATVNCLVSSILQNIIFGVQQKRETHIGLEQVEGM